MSEFNRNLVVRALSGHELGDMVLLEIHEIATETYVVNFDGEYRDTLNDKGELIDYIEAYLLSEDFYSLLSLKYDISKVLYESNASINTTVVSTLFGPTIFISSMFSEDDIEELVSDLNNKIVEYESGNPDEDDGKLYSGIIN